MRVAIAQLTSTASVDDNYAAVEPLVATAAAAGACLVALPECFAYMPPRAGASAAVAEPLDGPLFRRYAALAARHNVWLSLGGFHERDGPAVYNTHAVVAGGDGRLVAAYRKAHLFDAALPDGTAFRESDTISPGEELVVVANTPAGTLGLSTCYDVRFAGMYRALVDAGATSLLIPAAFAVGTGRDHWEVLVRARAIEGGVPVVAAAQVGAHAPDAPGNAGRRSWGHGLVVDSWGGVAVDMGDRSGAVEVVNWGGAWRRMPRGHHRPVDGEVAPVRVVDGGWRPSLGDDDAAGSGAAVTP